MFTRIKSFKYDITKVKPVALFFAGLFLSCFIIKLCFFLYNSGYFLSQDASQIKNNFFTLSLWSFYNDLLAILIINVPVFFILVFVLSFNKIYLVKAAIFVLFVLNTFMLLINALDIFYFRFHIKRSSADLYYVFTSSLKPFFFLSPGLIIVCLILFVAIVFISWKLHQYLLNFMKRISVSKITTAFLLMPVLVLVYFRHSAGTVLIPTAQLSFLNAKEVSLVQNSFHTFIYSLARMQHPVKPQNYFSTGECDSVYTLKKRFKKNHSGADKNVVLFIMEGMPYDYFDSSGQYNIILPFLDSIKESSTFFSNAYSYHFESNKGIVSILSGTPTITEMPLYNSSFLNIKMSHIGSLLNKKGYESFFCIGDSYDNYGFAKCINWLGFNRYYSKEEINKDGKAEMHPYGVHDGYTLPFFLKKINSADRNFFAVHFNISTHFPHTLPASYTQVFPASYTPAMKSAVYYDQCLNNFFLAAKNESWYSNTIFIFCSDHWFTPTGDYAGFNQYNSIHIPIIIYDPSTPVGKVINTPVSQFDLLGTFLDITSVEDTVYSHGGDLFNLPGNNKNRFVFNQMPNGIFQVLDTSFILGFDSGNSKPVYLFNYKTDKELKTDLLNQPSYNNKRNELLTGIECFLQKTTSQYYNQ